MKVLFGFCTLSVGFPLQAKGTDGLDSRVRGNDVGICFTPLRHCVLALFPLLQQSNPMFVTRLFLFALFLFVSQAQAQLQDDSFILRQGNAQFMLTNMRSTPVFESAGAGDFKGLLPCDGTDSMSQQWWWVRVEEAHSREFALFNQLYLRVISESEVEAAYVDSVGLQYTFRYQLQGGGLGSGAATLTINYRVVNPLTSTHNVHLYYYHDFDLAGGVEDDEVTRPAVDRVIQQEAGWRVETRLNPAPVAMEYGMQDTVRGKLLNEQADLLTDTAAPFTGEAACAMRWKGRLRPGGQMEGEVQLLLNAPVSGPCLWLQNALGFYQLGSSALQPPRAGTGGGQGVFKNYPDSVNSLFQGWWWYKVNTQMRAVGRLASIERLNDQTTRLIYDETSANLRIQLDYTLSAVDSRRSFLRVDYLVTNLAAGARTIRLFYYADPDLLGTGHDDEPQWLTYPLLMVREKYDTLYLNANPVPDRWEAANYDLLRAKLGEGVMTELDNIGVPFDGDDFTFAYQWTLSLASNASANGTAWISLNMLPPGAWTGGVPGDVNGDGCVNDEDLLAISLLFGEQAQGRPEDLNRDGWVDDVDLLQVLLNFGFGC